MDLYSAIVINVSEALRWVAKHCERLTEEDESEVTEVWRRNCKRLCGQCRSSSGLLIDNAVFVLLLGTR